MYVCLCKGITEKDIKQALASGECKSFRDVRDSFGVATECGSCCKDTHGIVNTHQFTNAVSPKVK